MMADAGVDEGNDGGDDDDVDEIGDQIGGMMLKLYIKLKRIEAWSLAEVEFTGGMQLTLLLSE